MNKSEFISAVAEKSGLSKVDAKKAVEAFVDTVSSHVEEISGADRSGNR